MDAELKQTIEELGTAVKQFEDVHKRVEDLEAKGQKAPDIEEQLGKIDGAVSAAQKAKDALEKQQGTIDDLTKKSEDAELASTKLREELDELAKKSMTPAGGGQDVRPEVAEHQKAFNTFLRKGEQEAGGDSHLRDLQLKATNTISNPDSGYGVPTVIDDQIIEVEREIVAMRSVCDQMTISTPDYKKLVNRGGAGSGWVGETDARPETNTPQLDQIPAFMGEIYANPASTQISLEDPIIDVEAWISREVAIEFSEQEDIAFTSGNGVNKPRGLMHYPTAAITDKAGTRPFATFEAVQATQNPGQIGGDDLIDAIHSLRAGYKSNAQWMCNNLTVAALRKLKDAEGNYLWRPGLIEGQPATLLTHTIVMNESIPDLNGAVAGDVPLLYGNFQRAYLILDRIGTSILRDPFTNKPYVHFYTTKRVGGMAVDSLAVKFIAIT